LKHIYPDEPMRTALYVIAALALAAVVVVGLSQAGDSGSEQPAAAPRFDLAEAQAQLAGAPEPLAGLHEQASELLATDRFQEQLDTLEGTPVVINKWASWCRPCRAEFPIFQQVATRRGKEVAFLGLNAADDRPAAEDFLAERPLPYPSYEDPDEELAQDLEVAKYFPMTMFIRPDGKTEFIKPGEYTSTAELEADIDRYLGA
jgi:cytochrome c biogenesis protein CcmG, thiol:disulfide interchange protein DsbE